MAQFDSLPFTSILGDAPSEGKDSFEIDSAIHVKFGDAL